MFPLKKNYQLFLLLLVSTLIVHWGGVVFYYWDEWHILERFQREGLSTIFHRHNEHFIPIFFGLYFAEVKLFGSFYRGLLLITLLLHGLNGLLLSGFLGRLGLRAATCQLATLLYVASSMHAEVFDWAFVQCVVLMTTLILLALNAAFDYFERGKVENFLVATFCCAIAPFVFGNGLISGVLIGLLWLTIGLLQQKFNREFILRGLKLLAPMGLLTLGALLIYRAHQEGSGHGVNPAQMFGNLRESAKYVLVGSQFGTVFRGLGFFPALELVSGEKLDQFLDIEFFTKSPPELLFAKAGIVLSLLILFLSLKFSQQSKRRTTMLWLFGQAFIAVAFVLPALGRWSFGLVQALSLRYYVLSTVGLAILLSPLIEAVLDSKQIRLRRLGGLFLVFYFSVHFAMARNLTYFTSRGAANIRFITELRGYKAGHRESMPPMPSELTPGKSPEEISKILEFIS